MSGVDLSAGMAGSYVRPLVFGMADRQKAYRQLHSHCGKTPSDPMKE